MSAAPTSVGTDPSSGTGREYQPLRSYAAIGDGRTVALIARDGSIDWLCIPDLDSPSVFGAILDSTQGGRFELCPEIPFTVERRYLPDTNVLETTFVTNRGRVRVTDAMTLPAGLAPGRELVRVVEGLSGLVPLRWSLEPRFGYGSSPGRLETRLGFPVALAGSDAVAVCSWSAGEPACTEGRVSARFEAAEGTRAQIALSISHQEPLVFPARHEVDQRLENTIAYWKGWASSRTHDGPWREAVIRSALALKLLVFAPSGAIAAAATTSLPEQLGGERNWDYRYFWVRDSAFTLDAFLSGARTRRRRSSGGAVPARRRLVGWLMQASQLKHPRLPAPERILDLDGYRGSEAGSGGKRGRRTEPARRLTAICFRPPGSSPPHGMGWTRTSHAGSLRSRTSSARSGESRTPEYGR